MQLSSYIPHTPRLRAIIVNAINWRGPEILEDSLHESVTQLPDLRSLRITHGTLSAGDVDRVKRIVQSKNLRTLGFLSCRFPLPPSSEPLQNEDGDHEHPQVSHGEMPQSMREWLAERVERVIVREIPPVH
ncbi:hypothetical protein FS749_002907 [Ceratobasidium sp. UAMH 11750]|nr:hypothetical protein FS749_002907 [Ceratobasidium sp. UAMH 11750]